VKPPVGGRVMPPKLRGASPDVAGKIARRDGAMATSSENPIFSFLSLPRGNRVWRAFFGRGSEPLTISALRIRQQSGAVSDAR